VAVITLYLGDAITVLRQLPEQSIQACITSPPYFQTRSYSTTAQIWADGWTGELGAETTIDAYTQHLVEVFRAVRDVLDDTGTLWINLGDAYAGSGYSNHSGTGGLRKEDGGRQRHINIAGIPNKNLLGIPWAAAFALRDDGWILRQCVTWEKRGTQPQPSAKDRPWTTHEYVFLFAKKPQYRYCGETTSSVWTFPVGRADGHHAVMPTELAERCIALSTNTDDTVLDPFAGSGATLWAADSLRRNAIGIELNREYCARMARRIDKERNEK
jgi:site-specific DNA-methyltransferase (cytosine-N4-specific)